MFDFLKNTLSVVYKKALDIELSINTLNLPNVMASFCETVLKNIYIKYDNKSDRNISSFTLEKLLNDKEFERYLNEKYLYFDLKEINKIRNESNKCKHDKEYRIESENFKKELFIIVFNLSSKYAKKEANVEVEFDQEKYNALIEDSNNVIKIIEKNNLLNKEIESIKHELIKLQNERGEKNFEIFNLKNKKKNIRESILDKKTLQEFKKAINDLEKEKDKLLKRRNELNQKYQITQNQANKLKIEIDNLKVDNTVLANSYDLKCLECEELNKEINNLLEQINSINKNQHYIEENLEQNHLLKSNSEFNDFTNEQEINKSIIDKLVENKELINSEILYSNGHNIGIDVLKGKLDFINYYLESNAPVCPVHSDKMVIRKNKKKGSYFYGCIHFAEEKCSPKIIIDMKLKEYLKIRKIIEDQLNVKELITLDDYHYEEISSYINKYQHYFFDSLALPNCLFNRKNINWNQYSKFQLITNCSKKNIPDEHKFIYSLVQRVLNRGIVLPCESDIEEIFNIKFNKDINAKVSDLFDFVKYYNPVFGYISSEGKDFDSKYESKFSNYAFKKILGKSWASYVLYQPNFSMIIPQSKLDEGYNSSRVDFYINKNGLKRVVEIDGNEHYSADGLTKDAARDKVLGDNGCQVYRFKNEHIDHLPNRDGELILSKEEKARLSNDFRNKLNDLYNDFNHDSSNDKIYLDLDQKFIFSVKLFHQLCISIVSCLEKGFINEVSNIKLKSENIDFSQEELDFICYFAIEKVTQLIKEYCKIYDVSLNINLSDSTKKTVNLYYGDGINKNDLIVIRDMSIDYDFLCEFEKPNEFIYPKNFDLFSAQYFLKYLFNYNSFREGQYQAIERIVFRKDSIILLPTGAGKSIIYQLGSFIVPGITIVVSPLKALINDQIDNLSYSFGITNAYKITSDQSIDDKNTVLFKIKNNNTSLLYLAPERFHIPTFKDSISKFLKSNLIYCLAIDEVHCVSEWGHDFRAAYINLSNVVKTTFKKDEFIPSIIGLTGTASKRVLNDVKRDLNIEHDDAIISAQSFDRNELNFEILKCNNIKKHTAIIDKIQNNIPEYFNVTYEEFISLNESNTFSGIIFTQLASTGETNEEKKYYAANQLREELSNKINDYKIKTYYSSTPKDMEDNEWRNVISNSALMFKTNKINLLVATKAFGMGIDKPNIRYIIHDGIPASFESYYQEAGRAGRDRNKSYCCIIFSNENDEYNEQLLDPSLNFDDFSKLYNSLKSKMTHDDLSTLLYFHMNTFKGIDVEMSIVKCIIEILKEKCVFSKSDIEEYLKDVKCDINIILKALIRLRILNVIIDYSYDYINQFKVELNNIDKNIIASSYANYVSNYDKGRIEKEQEKILSLQSTEWQLVIDAIQILISYSYDNFEKSRRREIKNIYDLAKKAIKIPYDRQNDFIRNEIINFFNTDNKYINAVQKILDSKDCGFNLIANNYDLYTVEENIEHITSEEIISDAEKNAAIALRELESNPDHPGLLYYSAISKLRANNIDENEILNEVKSANMYIRKNYNVNDKIISDMFIMTLNESLKKSYRLYEKLIFMYSEYEDKSKIVDKALKSNLISEENKDIILLDYLNDIL